MAIEGFSFFASPPGYSREFITLFQICTSFPSAHVIARHSGMSGSCWFVRWRQQPPKTHKLSAARTAIAHSATLDRCRGVMTSEMVASLDENEGRIACLSRRRSRVRVPSLRQFRHIPEQSMLGGQLFPCPSPAIPKFPLLVLAVPIILY